jgi:gluconolactonase
MWKSLVLIPVLTAVLAADSPVAPGQKPRNEGSVGAGEGPAWDGKGNLYFTGGGKITRRDSSGAIQVFRQPSGGANGLAFDAQGRLVICEGGNRRVTRVESNGESTVLADRYESMQFNSPNDLTIDSKGRIYFSDPRYGKRDTMEMKDSSGRLVEGVYRIDAPGKVTRVLSTEIERPNGLLVSPNDEYLYVADNNNNNVGGARKLWQFRLRADGSVDRASGKLVYNWENGRGPDGLKMDREGRLYVAGGRSRPNLPYESVEKFKGGIYVLSAEGRLIEFVPVPDDEVTNCTFGGPDLKTLFITAGGNLWSLRLNSPGWTRRSAR